MEKAGQDAAAAIGAFYRGADQNNTINKQDVNSTNPQSSLSNLYELVHDNDLKKNHD